MFFIIQYLYFLSIPTLPTLYSLSYDVSIFFLLFPSLSFPSLFFPLGELAVLATNDPLCKEIDDSHYGEEEEEEEEEEEQDDEEEQEEEEEEDDDEKENK